MAKSAAKKFRDKSVREGKRNPESNRSPFAFEDMRTRQTKTKKDHLYRSRHKNRFSEEYRRDGSFYFALKSFRPSVFLDSLIYLKIR
ncbi:hypothetical protein CYOC110262_15035 [Cytobacillus oceanisediminis]|uniref:Uncharacterized protein n=1 Tax=Cytobacillus oceanisediminis TaxID=665099 RepID=A0A562JDY4_9BACI|nr:hypothetical protein [Cytobacillus oceanisediminis]TWH81283.1 hypothetical protein IQ19_04326 [Cytobacillus oceanisediminis]